MSEEKKIRIIDASLVITTIVCLIPIIPGCILWDKLPDTMARHFDFQGNVNGYSSKLMCIVIFPCFLALLNFFMCLVFNIKAKKEELSSKLKNVFCWIMPIVSIIIFWTIIKTNLSAETANVSSVFFACGLVFTIIGNYLPKAPASIISFPVPPSILNDKKKVEDIKKIGARRMGYFVVPSGFLIMITAFTPINFIGFYVGLGLFIVGTIISVVTTWKQSKL